MTEGKEVISTEKIESPQPLKINDPDNEHRAINIMNHLEAVAMQSEETTTLDVHGSSNNDASLVNDVGIKGEKNLLDSLLDQNVFQDIGSTEKLYQETSGPQQNESDMSAEATHIYLQNLAMTPKNPNSVHSIGLQTPVSDDYKDFGHSSNSVLPTHNPSKVGPVGRSNFENNNPKSLFPSPVKGGSEYLKSELKFRSNELVNIAMKPSSLSPLSPKESSFLHSPARPTLSSPISGGGRWISTAPTTPTRIGTPPGQPLEVPPRDGTVKGDFLHDLYTFMIKIGQPITKTPHLGYQELDLYLLYTLVIARGGMDAVTRRQEWKTVYQDLGLPTMSTSASYNTRTNYKKHLYLYELEHFDADSSNRPADRDPIYPAGSPVRIVSHKFGGQVFYARTIKCRWRDDRFFYYVHYNGWGNSHDEWMPEEVLNAPFPDEESIFDTLANPPPTRSSKSNNIIGDPELTSTTQVSFGSSPLYSKSAPVTPTRLSPNRATSPEEPGYYDKNYAKGGSPIPISGEPEQADGTNETGKTFQGERTIKRRRRRRFLQTNVVRQKSTRVRQTPKNNYENVKSEEDTEGDEENSDYEASSALKKFSEVNQDNDEFYGDSRGLTPSIVQKKIEEYQQESIFIGGLVDLRSKSAQMSEAAPKNCQGHKKIKLLSSNNTHIYCLESSASYSVSKADETSYQRFAKELHRLMQVPDLEKALCVEYSRGRKQNLGVDYLDKKNEENVQETPSSFDSLESLRSIIKEMRSIRKEFRRNKRLFALYFSSSELSEEEAANINEDSNVLPISPTKNTIVDDDQTLNPSSPIDSADLSSPLWSRRTRNQRETATRL